MWMLQECADGHKEKRLYCEHLFSLFCQSTFINTQTHNKKYKCSQKSYPYSEIEHGKIITDIHSERNLPINLH